MVDSTTNKNDAWLDERLEKPSELPPASKEFRQNVMKKISAMRLPWHVRLRRFLFKPRQTQWSMASGMVTASIALVFIFSLNQHWQSSTPPNEIAMTTPEFITVSFRVQLQGAQKVALAGGFNKWQPVHMVKSDGKGVWDLEVKLKPGQYEYMFVVDGENWVSDPQANLYQDDGFGGKNSVIVVNQVKQNAI